MHMDTYFDAGSVIVLFNRGYMPRFDKLIYDAVKCMKTKNISFFRIYDSSCEKFVFIFFCTYKNDNFDITFCAREQSVAIARH